MLRSIKELDKKSLDKKRVLIRVDFNVPIQDGKVLDDTRIVRSLPTIKYLLENNAYLIITSHLGRPKGSVVPELSLKPVAEHLAKLIDREVVFIDQTIGFEVDATIKSMGEHYQIVLLENTRFNKGEKKNDPEFAKELAKNAEIFVSDAFGTVHRAHASVVGVSEYIPSYAGLLVEQEYIRITSAMISPESPSLAIVGGAKVSTKLDVINNFIDSSDVIFVGGGMVFTFYKSLGREVGNSLVEDDMITMASSILEKARVKGVKIILPVDVRISKSFDEPIIENNVAKIVSWENIPKDAMGLDIGPESENLVVAEINNANTIIWNGPMGVFEKELFLNGTKIVAETIIKRNVETIIGGGDTAFALKLAGIKNIPPSIHVSTGGGASLELLSKLFLPGIACLKK